MKEVVCAFDFDGTLIRKDSFLEFIKYTHGLPYFLFSFFLFSPVLVLYKIKLISNSKAKQLIFSWFYKGWTLPDFNEKCNSFVNTITYRKEDVYSTMLNHIKDSHNVIVVSASIENWIAPWAKGHGVNTVCATQIEVGGDNVLTGRFKSKNCYGKEKVNRLLELFPNRENYTLYAYGDSAGDKELFDFADHKIKV